MKQKLFYTTEGKIFITGVLLSLLLLMVIGYFLIVDLEVAKTLGVVFIAHTFGGRAAGIGLCIINNFGATSTILYNFYLEVLIVCYTYSIFVLTANNYIRVAWVTNFMKKLSAKAVEQKEKIHSFGWIGIFLFVMLPLPGTGPVVGSVIGYMLKINLAKNFSATASGTMAAIIIWFYCFDFLEDKLHVIQYVFAAIVIIVVITHYKAIKNFLFGKKN